MSAAPAAATDDDDGDVGDDEDDAEEPGGGSPSSARRLGTGTGRRLGLANSTGRAQAAQLPRLPPAHHDGNSSSTTASSVEHSESDEESEQCVQSGRETTETEWDSDGPAHGAAALPAVPVAAGVAGAVHAIGAMQAAAAPALPVAAQAAPIDTGIFSHRKVPRAPIAGLNWTVQAIGGHLLRYESNSAGTELIRILKHEKFNPQDLPNDAETTKNRIARQMEAELPMSSVTVRKLTLSTLETQPPPRPWRNATVASRGVVPCLVSMLTNPKVVHWDKLLKFDPAASPVPAGEADEPFHASVCREGCAAAIARGVAMGWAKEDVFPVPIMHSSDGMTPDLTGKTKLDPIAMFLAILPYEIRRSVIAGAFDSIVCGLHRSLDFFASSPIAGEHVFLIPEILLGKIRTAKLKRDQRRAIQVCVLVLKFRLEVLVLR
jgi:hypothetical protein